jgi:hypothetical protein
MRLSRFHQLSAILATMTWLFLVALFGEELTRDRSIVELILFGLLLALGLLSTWALLWGLFKLFRWSITSGPGRGKPAAETPPRGVWDREVDTRGG